MAITGEPDGMPMKHGVAITDVITGMNSVQAILAALVVGDETHVSIPSLSTSTSASKTVSGSGEGAPLTTTESRHLSEPEESRMSKEDSHPSIKKALDNPISPEASAQAPMHAVLEDAVQGGEDAK